MFSICLVAIMAFAACVNDDKPAEAVSLVAVGDRLPEFEVVMNDGRRVDTRSLAGAPSMIVFFNTTCSDCRHELPVIQAVHEQMPSLAIVCIARAQSADDIAAYWSQNGLTLPYSAQDTRDVYNIFATGVIPRIYVSDSSLTVRAIFDDTDMPTADRLIKLVESL